VIRVGIQSDRMDGVHIGILNRHADGTADYLAGFPEGFAVWKHLTPQERLAIQEPSLRLPDDVARAVMDELIRYYHGSSDTLALRRDYDHERGRADKMIDALITMAARGTA
jgi:hypothetical protein